MKAMVFPRPFWLALAFLTRLPVPPLGHVPARELGAALAWFPVVGGVLGLCLWLAARLGPEAPELAAVWVLILWVALSGNLHLDGLADTLDALAGGRDPQVRLALLKDPRSGPAALSGVGLVLLAKFTALGMLLEAHAWMALVAVPVLGRVALAGCFLVLPYLRETGLGRAFADHMDSRRVGWAMGGGVLAVVLSGGWGGVVAVLAGGVIFWASMLYWRRRFNGFTGDLAGATLEMVETTTLFVWAWVVA